MREKGVTKTLIFILILGLNYIPLVFLPLVNGISGNIGGFPIVWIYMIIWVLYSFTMLVITYLIDRKLGD